MSRHRSGEARVFGVAVLLLLVHAVDDAFVHRGTGLGLGQHALAGALSLVLGLAALLAFPRSRPGVRAALAFSLGGLGLVNGGLHVAHVLDSAPSGGDFTGILAAGAAAVLVGLAAWIPWHHRGMGAATRGRRWAVRVLIVPAGLIASIFVLGPVALGIVETHKWRETVGDPPSAAYQEVSFKASDGLDITGWYRPSENGANVLVAHGGGSDRKGSVAHASMLARHGYGVLLYDARGRGESDGTPNNFGWDWGKDVAGALAYLQARDDVDPARIGALGLSTGADVLLEVAGQRDDFAALVTDGAAAGSFQDWHHLRGPEVITVPGWVMFSAMRVFSGDPPGPPLEELVTRIDAPTLLISAGTDVERDFNALYDEAAADGPVEHWNLPDAHHTAAIREAPEDYERRVTAFLDAALL